MKKGFTLIEVLAVIVIITLITLMVVPNLLNSVNNKKKDVSDVAKQMIYDAADLYIKENTESYPIEENAIYCIKLETLVNNGKLSNPVKDLKNDKEIPLSYYVKASINEFNQYSYTLVNNSSCAPAIAYYITDQNKYTKEKSITIKYPSSNYVKKYKVTSGTTKENIALNTEQTVTENPTITFTSNGSIKFWIEDNGTKLSETTANITKIDTTVPTLTLSKETYIEDDFSGWELTNAEVTEEDGHKVLVLGSNGSNATANSNFIDVNYGKYYISFDIYPTQASSNYSPKGGIFIATGYHDESYQSTNASNGSQANGWARDAELNKWTQLKHEYGIMTANNFKNLQFSMQNLGDYGKSPSKIRNLRIYGDKMPNSFYLINVVANDTDSKVKSIKYAKGDKDSRYFENAGETVNNHQIRVTSNGVYSVCVTDNAGNMKIEKITIDQIN